MPPWKSEPGYGEFIGHRPLSDAEIGVIQQWLADGAPEGDRRDLPAPPQWTDGWQLGTPDLIVTLPRPYVLPADGTDVSRVFVLPLPVGTMRYVRGLEFRPGNQRVVHHANIRIDRTPASRQLDDQDPAPGYDGAALAFRRLPRRPFSRLDAGPGRTAAAEGPGVAPRAGHRPRRRSAHEAERQDRSASSRRSASTSADDPPERTPAMLRLGRQSIDIAAGEKHYTITDSFVLPVDVEVQAVQPHAHYRAREVTGVATLPDGTTKWLIYIKDWDFRWQHVYRYVTPFALPQRHDARDALHLRQLGGQPAQPAAAAAPCPLGAVVERRDGRLVDSGADARRSRSAAAERRLSPQARSPRTSSATRR